MTFDLQNINKEFRGVFLSSDKVTEVVFEDCSFHNSKFIGTTFENCQFISCIFEECLFEECSFPMSTINGVSFKETKLIQIDFTNAREIFSLSFLSSNLSFINFSFLKLPELVLTDSEAKFLDFKETNLKGANFTNSNLEGTVFLKSNLHKADFRQAYNYDLDFKANNISKASFSLPEATALLKSLDIILE